jgi:SPX domain protein involved in polyphosphate accumulation
MTDNGMPIEPASRYELKLTIEGHWLPQTRSWLHLSPGGLRKTYPSRKVNSAYLDTLEFDDLRANLAGVSQRQKLRLRWYGNNRDRVVQCSLELKRKRNMLGEKKRIELPKPLDLTRKWALILSTVRKETPAEWQPDLVIRTQPTLLTSYQREYYATADNVVRATLDYNLEVFDQRYSSRPNLSHRHPVTDLVVIELKASPEEEDRLEEIITRFPIRRTRNSKYVTGTQAGLS